MTVILAAKLAIILIFIILFIRRPSFSWGIGLLTVTTALLLDTLIGTFEAQDLQAELGFYYYIIAGALFGGAAIWLFGVLLPYIMPKKSFGPVQGYQETGSQQSLSKKSRPVKAVEGFDRQMICEMIKERFGHEDILDLMFDMGINENEVMPVNQDTNLLISNILDYAEDNGETGKLSLSVERILTPLPPEYLPRLKKLSPESPPTILRHYLLTHYSLEELKQFAFELDVDWDQLDYGSKREKSRSLLQFLYRRNRVDELVALMQETGKEISNDTIFDEVEIIEEEE